MSLIENDVTEVATSASDTFLRTGHYKAHNMLQHREGHTSYFFLDVNFHSLNGCRGGGVIVLWGELPFF